MAVLIQSLFEESAITRSCSVLMPKLEPQIRETPLAQEKTGCLAM